MRVCQGTLAAGRNHDRHARDAPSVLSSGECSGGLAADRLPAQPLPAAGKRSPTTSPTRTRIPERSRPPIGCSKQAVPWPSQDARA
jgi:hypothetical protein